MKNAILLSCACALSIGIVTPSLAETTTQTPPQRNQQAQALIDDWVDYKLNEKQIAERLEMSRKEFAQLKPENTAAYEQQLLNLSNDAKRVSLDGLNQLKPRTTEVQQLLKMKLQLTEQTFDFMITEMLTPVHTQEKNRQEQYLSKYDQLTKLTKAIKQHEDQIETQVWQNLKQQQSLKSQ